MDAAHDDIYSRSAGLIENDALMKKRVLVIGLGSFGSVIAVDLAKAAVGSFALMDFDRLERHNVVRHACYLQDVGRLKTDAVADLVFGKNPYATVDKFSVDMNEDLDLLAREIDRADLVICATDNNTSRFNLSRLLVSHPKTCLFGRAVTRAEGGDVFRARPGGACYCCLIGNKWFDAATEEITDKASARRSGRIAAYVSEEDADAMVQVGLASDIEPITNMMTKLALVELSRGTNAGISALEQELVYDYYMWANRRERRHRNWSSFADCANRPTILRWYGAHIARNEKCALCGAADEIALDEGDDVEAQLDAMGGDADDAK